jgi:hypothetical protein
VREVVELETQVAELEAKMQAIEEGNPRGRP